MKKILPQIFVFSAGLALCAAITACDTGEGLGEDLQDAGEAIEDAAQDAQEE